MGHCLSVPIQYMTFIKERTMNSFIKLRSLVVVFAFFYSTAYAQDETAKMLNTLKILNESDAKILITINKDLSTDVINLQEGTRAKPCNDIDERNELLSAEDKRLKCYPVGHNPYGKILKTTNIEIREGSICATIVSGSRLYVLCQPPYDLGF